MDDHGQEKNENGEKISQFLFCQRSISQNSWPLFHRGWENVLENRRPCGKRVIMITILHWIFWFGKEVIDPAVGERVRSIAIQVLDDGGLVHGEHFELYIL